MKDSEDGISPSLDAAYKNLMAALEMYEGELWRSTGITRGWSLNLVGQARGRLQAAQDKLSWGPLMSRRDR